MVSHSENNSKWTPERDQLIKDLWGQGKSATEIAEAIGGWLANLRDHGRSAVCGRIKRLELPKRSAQVNVARVSSKPHTYRVSKKAASSNTGRSNLPAILQTAPKESGYKIARPKPGGTVMIRPVENYAFGHKLSPFPASADDPDGATLADIRAIEAFLYV
jgi:GcrA cell cycle regulator